LTERTRPGKVRPVVSQERGTVTRTRFLVVLLAATTILPASVSAQPNASQPDMSIDARAKAETIASLTKGLREDYVFPGVGDAVAKMLEERNARGEYNSITSAKAFCDLLTKQMSEIAHDKHLRFVYSSEVLPPLPVSKPGELPAYPDDLPQLREAITISRRSNVSVGTSVI
jgi:hypothetical protein